MTQVKEARKFPHSAQRCFEACKDGFPLAGFPIWKTREIAYLVMANRVQDGQTISATALIMGDSPAEVTLSVSGEGLSEAELKGWSERLFSTLEASLGQK
jgi:hypothetical protein